ncbi:MAG: hypothetical protein JSS72_11605 [Armatimonadetes bacterium]|nr:hypothetical protein [Armatimonadota bacterium]
MDQNNYSSVLLIFGLLSYILFALPLYAMGKKIGSNNPWFAFVPILNILLMLEIGGKPMWWIILMFIPCVNAIVAVIVWMAIAEAMDKPSWLGLLMLVPGVNFLLPFYLAYA